MKWPASVLVLAILSSLLLAQAPSPATQPAAAVNKKCPVSAEDVSPRAKTVQYKDKTVGFCCDDCVALFNKNPDKYADKVK
jgi:hypothetical protein